MALAYVTEKTSVVPVTVLGVPYTLIYLSTSIYPGHTAGILDTTGNPNIATQPILISTVFGQKFYDGIVFHRVIDGFMAQTGDPTGTGMGGSKMPNLKAEFSDEPHVRGALSMARSGQPDSANSQFFIVTHDSRFLDGQYTVWGRGIKGMEFVDKIKKGAGQSGSVSDPDAMIKVSVAADVEKK